MLPDQSILMSQKLVENAKIQKFKYDILRCQKLIKNAKNGPFWRFYETVSPDRSTKGQNLVENAKIEILQTQHFE